MSKLVSNERDPAPPNATLQVLDTSDNIQLRTAYWTPKEKIKGTVLLFQGYAEFIEKYFEVISDLLTRNLAVVTFDWRGQGLSTKLLSDPLKGYVASFEDFIQDADKIYTELMLSLPKPHFIMGHSMGGNIATRFIQKYPNRFEKAILCGPMFGWPNNISNNMILIVGKLYKILGLDTSYVRGAGPPDLENKIIPTSDKVRYQKRVDFYQLEKRFLMGGPTVRWVYEGTKSIIEVFKPKNLEKIQIPILLASGLKDHLASPYYHEQFAKQCNFVKLLQYPDAEHEILHEKDHVRNQFWQEFDIFINLFRQPD